MIQITTAGPVIIRYDNGRVVSFPLADIKQYSVVGNSWIIKTCKHNYHLNFKRGVNMPGFGTYYNVWDLPVWDSSYYTSQTDVLMTLGASYIVGDKRRKTLKLFLDADVVDQGSVKNNALIIKDCTGTYKYSCKKGVTVFGDQIHYDADDLLTAWQD